MTLKEQMQKELTAAMKARDEDTKRTLRLVMSAVKLAEIENRGELETSRIISILQKEVKTHEDSIREAQIADRKDLIDQAQREIEILNKFLPKQMDPEELKQLAIAVIEETNAASLRDMGLVMKNLIPKLEGRASGQDASKIVREILQAN